MWRPGWRSDLFIAQQQAEQPAVVKLWLLYVASFLGLRELTSILIHVGGFYKWTQAHHSEYIAIFFAVQFLITFSMVIWVAKRYRTALFLPRPPKDRTGQKANLVAVLVALPFLFYEGSKIIRHSSSIITMATLRPDSVEELMREAWTAVIGGYSFPHVLFSSLLIFAGPALEEMVFTGIALNQLSRRLPIFVAITACALLFTATHFLSISTYVLENSAKYFFMSLTMQSVRLISGRLDLSVVFHIFANILVFIPKWVLASIYYASR